MPSGPGAQDLPAEEHVRRRVDLRRQREVLIDGLDPQVARLMRGVDRDGLTLEEDLALVGRMDSDHRLDQRALARAVVAYERDDLLRVDGEVRASQRLHAAKALYDLARLKHGLGHGCCSSSSAGAWDGGRESTIR